MMAWSDPGDLGGPPGGPLWRGPAPGTFRKTTCRAWQMVRIGILGLSVSACLIIDLPDDAIARRTYALYISRNYENHLIL